MIGDLLFAVDQLGLSGAPYLLDPDVGSNDIYLRTVEAVCAIYAVTNRLSTWKEVRDFELEI